MHPSGQAPSLSALDLMPALAAVAFDPAVLLVGEPAVKSAAPSSQVSAVQSGAETERNSKTLSCTKGLCMVGLDSKQESCKPMMQNAAVAAAEAKAKAAAEEN